MKILTNSDIARALSLVGEGRLEEYLEPFDAYLYSIVSSEPGARKVRKLIDDDFSLYIIFSSFCVGFEYGRRSCYDK